MLPAVALPVLVLEVRQVSVAVLLGVLKVALLVEAWLAVLLEVLKVALPVPVQLVALQVQVPPVLIYYQQSLFLIMVLLMR